MLQPDWKCCRYANDKGGLSTSYGSIIVKDSNIKKLLIQYYNDSYEIDEVNFSNYIRNNLDYIIGRISKNKGVYTVLITLAFYKTLYPEQDIRQHKIELPNGFSGRSFDTKYITPTLMELGLPSMKESGWLTRSLEQAYPYDKNFNGKITPPMLKKSFLQIVDEIQKDSYQAKKVLRYLLHGAIKYKENNVVEIRKISRSDANIEKIIALLKIHFTAHYDTHGASKLPVLAFFAIYSIFMPEISRYDDALLLPLGSHTASDRTSKSSGDIQISKDNGIFEAIEIKLDRPITPQIVRIAYEKINKFGVKRYYILSGVPIAQNDNAIINSLISKIEVEHGCQIIVNGIYQSLKYYLRLVSKPVEFLDKYAELVSIDDEIDITHKRKLVELLSEYFG
jgi:DNA (cytosine-5)-methyltransferase 1